VWTSDTLLIFSASVTAVAAVIKGLFWLVDRILQHCWVSQLARDICAKEGPAALEHLVPLVRAQRPKKRRLPLPDTDPDG
jgi:hypothetical protein